MPLPPKIKTKYIGLANITYAFNDFLTPASPMATKTQNPICITQMRFEGFSIGFGF